MGKIREVHPKTIPAKTTKPQKLPAISKKNFFPIVAIGASAGGLEALEIFFKHIPTDIQVKIAYVVIMHLDPNHHSILPELLQKATKLKVLPITDKIKIQPGHVYVIPPGKTVTVQEKIFKLVEHKTHSTHMVIDAFFQSLAEEQEHKIIAIILSGTGMDGVQGLRTISGAGGLIMAQEPTTAKYPGMPSSAISTGLVDYVLPPEKMPQQLLNYLHNDSSSFTLSEEKRSKKLQPIFHLLRTHMGHDFSLYKYNTICRRIEKRMSIHQIGTIELYTRYLQYNPQEVEILFRELLIGVTNFFRNPEAFKALKQIIITKILHNKPNNYCVRIWVPACATGEEVYSLAILFYESMEESNCSLNIQIFGTDIDEAAIEIARAGIYPSNIEGDVSDERLKRFFTKENKKMYKVSKNIRKMVIFAPQSIIKDPPFTKLDLLSCRNLLIYLTAELQKKLLPLFYHSLNHNGILFLGSAESISGFTELFNPIDKKWKIFKRSEGVSAFERREGISSLQTTLEANAATQSDKMQPKIIPVNKKLKESHIAQMIETVLLESYTPTCVVVNEKDDIVYIYGRAGKYLEPAQGAPNLNILQMARSGLKGKLASALHQLAGSNSQKKQVSYTHLQIKDNDKLFYINLSVKLLKEFNANRNWKLVIIEDVEAPQPIFSVDSKHLSVGKLRQRMLDLEAELKRTKENLQITIGELETSNEELKSTNEELQSTNEELQSTNEELETSKEELQSLNEELTTVNTELEARIEELSSANDDIQNLLYSTEIATIFLDNKLNIKRFTPKATELTNLIQTDVGRPISDIVSKLKYETLVNDAQKVLNSLSSKSVEVQDKEGHWYQVRIMPYRTLNNMIDGVVITFLNIHMQKLAEEKVTQLNAAMQSIQKYTTLIIDTAHEPLLVLDEKFHVLAANTAFYETFGTSSDKIHGQLIYTFWNKQLDSNKLRQLLEVTLNDRNTFGEFEINYAFSGNNYRKVSLNVRKIESTWLYGPHILLAMRLGEAVKT